MSWQRYRDARKVSLAEAQVNVNHPTLRGTRVPTPRVEEQESIVRRNLAISSEIKISRKNLARPRQLKSTLMQDHLTGRVSADAITY